MESYRLKESENADCIGMECSLLQHKSGQNRSDLLGKIENSQDICQGRKINFHYVLTILLMY